MRFHWQRFWLLTRPEQLFTLLSLLGLPVMHLCLRLVGFRRLYRWCQNWSVPQRLQQYCYKDDPERIAFLVHTISKWGWLPVNCLPRSLWLYWWLVQADPDVVLWIGVSRETSEFGAHAWVSYHGQPLAEEPQLLSKFAPILASGI